MRYAYDVVVPKNTLECIPYEMRLKLHYGTLKQVVIRFRGGCHHRVSVALYDALFRILPVGGTAGMYGDDQMVSVPMDWPVYEAPFELIFKGWSPGSFYSHTISLWLDLEEVVERGRVDVIEQLKHLLEM